jgi:hypothetical protein
MKYTDETAEITFPVGRIHMLRIGGTRVSGHTRRLGQNGTPAVILLSKRVDLILRRTTYGTLVGHIALIRPATDTAHPNGAERHILAPGIDSLLGLFE